MTPSGVGGRRVNAARRQPSRQRPPDPRVPRADGTARARAFLRRPWKFFDGYTMEPQLVFGNIPSFGGDTRDPEEDTKCAPLVMPLKSKEKESNDPYGYPLLMCYIPIPNFFGHQWLGACTKISTSYEQQHTPGYYWEYLTLQSEYQYQ